MTPARFDHLTAALNLGETRIAEMTGYSRDAVKNWRRRGRVWPPFAAWLEAVAPQVAEILAQHPPPNRNRGQAPAAPPELVAAVLRSLPPPGSESREQRRAAIEAGRAARAAGPRATEPEKRPDLTTAGLAGPMFPKASAAIAAAIAEFEAPPVELAKPEASAVGPATYCSRCGRTFRGARCRCEAA